MSPISKTPPQRFTSGFIYYLCVLHFVFIRQSSVTFYLLCLTIDINFANNLFRVSKTQCGSVSKLHYYLISYCHKIQQFPFFAISFSAIVPNAKPFNYDVTLKTQMNKSSLHPGIMQNIRYITDISIVEVLGIKMSQSKYQ